MIKAVADRIRLRLKAPTKKYEIVRPMNSANRSTIANETYSGNPLPSQKKTTTDEIP